MTQFILYTSEDGQAQVQLRTDRGTVWLNQKQMAELFNVSQDNIALHLKNIYDDDELQREATSEESSVVQTQKKQTQTNTTKETSTMTDPE
ncbi:hypothetical protein [Thioflexithrix psekupsensis]|uniref:hypothetical protein n=1 Tax=Thioflexithrix psekupsensis TaxID=1570016 RepID=UPI001FD93178|nr:hypothetical protein [Thioflexithrix psekupsensis]